MLECHDVAVSGSSKLKIPKSCDEIIIGGDSTRLDRIMDSCRSLIGKSRSRSTKQDHVLLCYCRVGWCAVVRRGCVGRCDNGDLHLFIVKIVRLC